ncbi:MAG: polysaccharide biosynthesis protein [Leptospirales bacterium]|nr:polysaccharide biosynthesis protein [Leptospirales bacterium]
MNREKRILIVGAGEAGLALAGDLAKRKLKDNIAGFVDDDFSKIGSVISDIEVYGPIKSISEICHSLKISDVMIAIPSASSALINNVFSSVVDYDRSINLYFVPSSEKFFDSTPIFPSLREFSYSELLGRDEFSIDIDLMQEYFCDKKILITGAGGSIGAEICKQLMKFNVGKIIALGRGENSIYNLKKDMDDYVKMMAHPVPIEYKIVDVKDYRLLDRTFNEERPHIVFHAAAHKHVPLMESNEAEAAQNNILGTNNVLDIAAKYLVEKFVLISTDKAVRPTNVMGATKRVAESLTSYYGHKKNLKFTVVRFGNVLGSRGSVIPLFQDQIKSGSPVTVTHPDVTRYFMSIPEASLLVINSAAISSGGEIYVLDMGEQYKIDDIAKRMIELYGYNSEVEYIGLRPGDKLYEELYYNKGEIIKTGNSKILLLLDDNNILSDDEFDTLIKTVVEKVPYMTGLEVREFLKRYAPEYDY